MSMITPDGCPYCRCSDIRQITIPSVDLIAYRCHQCQRLFYVADVQMPPSSGPSADIRTRARKAKRLARKDTN